ncbi:hypothetical protein CBL_00272 [Carabus blaptoides fortunei]
MVLEEGRIVDGGIKTAAADVTGDVCRVSLDGRTNVRPPAFRGVHRKFPDEGIFDCLTAESRAEFNQDCELELWAPFFLRVLLRRQFLLLEGARQSVVSVPTKPASLVSVLVVRS